MNLKPWLGACAIAISSIAAILGGTAFGAQEFTPPVGHWVVQQPEEDEPGWNCATMGNKICGPQS